jgi:hypothetical protein
MIRSTNKNLTKQSKPHGGNSTGEIGLKFSGGEQIASGIVRILIALDRWKEKSPKFLLITHIERVIRRKQYDLLDIDHE